MNSKRQGTLQSFLIKHGIICYTILFTITFTLAYSPFIIAGKTLIWEIDGRRQHFPALVYNGRYIRSIIHNLLNGNFTIPMFDFNMGAGADIISTLNAYGLGDPLNLLSAMVPARYCEYIYIFLVVLRIYLSGLAFYFLCRYFKKRRIYTLIGSLIYSFSGFTIFNAVRHPDNFFSPMIQLPLLIIGVDLILRKKKPFLFIISVFYSALCGYYMLYMMTLMIGIYFLIRATQIYFPSKLRRLPSVTLRVAGSYLLGLGLSAVIFLPSLYGFIHSSRSATEESALQLFYDGSYIRDIFYRFIAPPGSWDYLSLAAIVFLSVILLVYDKKHPRYNLKLLLFIAMIIYLFPLGGYIFNGFQYPSQRWTFGLVLILSYTVVEMLPQLLDLNDSQRIVCFIAVLLYGISIFIIPSGRNVKYSVVGACMLVTTLLVLTILPCKFHKYRICAHSLGTVCCLFVVIGNVSINAIYRFASDQTGYSNEFLKIGQETEIMESRTERIADYYVKNEWGRADSTSFDGLSNGSMIWQVPTLLSHYSVMDSGISEFWSKTEGLGQRFSFAIDSTDQRTMINTLLSVRYTIEKKGHEKYVPFGYSPIGVTDNGYTIYENDYYLPMGYTYDSYITYDALSSMDGLQMQETLLQSIALDNPPFNHDVQKGILEFNTDPIYYKITNMENIQWNSNNMLEVQKDKATLTLSYSIPENTEGYLRFSGLDINSSGVSNFNLNVKSQDVSKSALVSSLDYNWYYGRKNYLFNLGYSTEKRTECTITFPKKGVYHLDNIEVFSVPMNSYINQIEQLREEPMENIEFAENRISGTITLSKDKVLCVTVPNSSGWTATVDGKRKEILRGNFMFMALPLTEGTHDIVFTYCSPGIKAGLLISILSMVTVVGIYIRYHRKKRRGKENG